MALHSGWLNKRSRLQRCDSPSKPFPLLLIQQDVSPPVRATVHQPSPRGLDMLRPPSNYHVFSFSLPSSRASRSFRDLSLENILLDNNGLAKIIDFGMALKVGQPHGVFSGSRSTIPPTGACGKTSYMAPEVARTDQPYDGFAVDIWACGAVLFM